MKQLDSAQADFAAELDALLEWDISEDDAVASTAADIIRAVRDRKDEALLDYTRKLDRLPVEHAADLEIQQAELDQALARIDDARRLALQGAADRIRAYHEHQLQASWSFEDEYGNRLGQRVLPLERVGVYVPGGQACYPSSVLMTLLPAKVAGVEELIVTVPTPDGERNDTVLAALAIGGADRVFTVGGAQAVAALAYGTQTLPRVDKIVGPGGAYVAAAKRQVFGQVGIDLIAGPSEVCVLADAQANVDWVAWDLFSQAEHDPSAQAICISPDGAWLARLKARMDELMPGLKRHATVQASLSQRGALIKAQDMADAIAIANRIAPEHLELHIEDASARVDEIRHAGAIFIGGHAGESFGDYVAGPSHVLPTFGTARFASPLGVYDFQKRSSLIYMTEQGAAHLADIAVPIAEAEGLQAHAAAAAVRAGN